MHVHANNMLKTHHHQVDSRCSTTVEILHDALVDPKGETRSVSSQYQPPTKGFDTNLKTGAPTTKTKMVIHIERDWNETCPRRKSAQRGIDDEQSQESKSCSSRRTPRIRLRSGRSSQLRRRASDARSQKRPQALSGCLVSTHDCSALFGTGVARGGSPTEVIFIMIIVTSIIMSMSSTVQT